MRGKRILLAALVWAPAALAPAAEAAGAGPAAAGRKAIATGDVRPGMTGYGLTVFRGERPERFPVEVIDVVPGMLPQSDVVLVRCLDERIEHAKIIAGMSGSPIYLFPEGADKKRDGEALLLGALSFGWRFQRDAVAGVTPIAAMRRDLEAARGAPARPAARGGPTRAETERLAQRNRFAARALGRAIGPPAAEPGEEAMRRALTLRPRGAPAAAGGLRPLPLVLSVGACPAPVLAHLRGAGFAAGACVPARGGSLGPARAGGGERAAAPPRLAPGEAAAIQLVRGDEDWSAVGTVTDVDGEEVLLFGHPFGLAGEDFRAPVTRARVHAVIASQLFSFKLSTSGEEVGALVSDRANAVVGRLGARAAMIPVSIDVAAREAGAAGGERGSAAPPRRFRYEIVPDRSFAPLLAALLAWGALEQAAPFREGSILTVTERVEFEGHAPLALTQRIPSRSAIAGAFAVYEVLDAVVENPFRRVAPRSLALSFEVRPGLRVAEIEALRFDRDEAVRGAPLTAIVRLKPHRRPAEEMRVEIPVPAEPRAETLSVRVAAGSQAWPPSAPPRNFDEYLANLARVYRETDLVVELSLPTRGVRHAGRVLPALPPSAVRVLMPPGVIDQRAPAEVADVRHLVRPTGWVLWGAAAASLPLRDR